MRAWVFYLIVGVIVLFAQPSTFDGGILDGLDSAAFIGAAIFIIIAILVRPTEESLIERAGDRLDHGWAGCAGLILTVLFWITIGSFALFALGLVAP